MIDGLHHLAIQCADLAACERFYVEVLGLRVLRRWPRDGAPGDRSVWLATAAAPDATFVALERAEGPAAPRPWRDGSPGLHLAAFRIAAAERGSWEARLAAAGVEVVHRSPWTLYVRDPEGNRLGLSHFPDDA
jgi:catechol 2,3-dioxygenase-like lactoylglutathione lyase family enzyme